MRLSRRRFERMLGSLTQLRARSQWTASATAVLGRLGRTSMRQNSLEKGNVSWVDGLIGLSAQLLIYIYIGY